MNSKHLVGRVVLVAALGACAAEAPVDSGPSAEAASALSAAGLAIEAAERALDRGGDPRQAAAELEAVLSRASLTAAERQTAVIALSRAHELAGEPAEAARVVEAELAAHADERDFDDEPLARRLRWLLTGAEATPGPSVDRDEPVAPFAHVVASFFPPDPTGAVKATFFLAGGDSTLSDELGTFNLRGALRQAQEQACPLCEPKVNVSQSVRQGDWLIIPASERRFGEALLVFYFDLGKNRIPARYERHLPMKVADIVAELEQNHAFVVAKSRPGAPPVLLLAAPRTALLEEVERHLAGKKELPASLEHVEVSPALRPGEIRHTMRAQWFPQVRACYDALLTRDAKAGGKIVLAYRIAGADGRVHDLEVQTEVAALQEPAFVACVERSAGALSFPATRGDDTTVRYPVQFTPD